MASSSSTPWDADIDPSTWSSSTPDYSERSESVASVAALVQTAMQKNDASHDFSHVARVHKLALQIAEAAGESDAATLELIELTALLHDVDDWKYAQEGAEKGLCAFLD